MEGCMSSINLLPKFSIIGHRGAGGLSQENTLESFITAANLGINWVEFDIRLTKDNIWVVLHDETVDKTTTATGYLADLSLKQVKQIDSGKIPTLIEAFDIVNKYSLYSFIDVKSSLKNPKKQVDLLLEFIQNNPSAQNNNYIISNFDLNFLTILRERNKTIPISYLIDKFSPYTLDIARKNNFSTINCYFDNLKIENLAAAQKYNIPIFAYTINDPKIAGYWLNQGVTAIFTDRPDLLKNL
jgi:glycerophosphoryl diester phosphodiesterase